MAKTIARETKKGRPKKGQKMNNLHELRKRERVNPFCGRKLSHPWPLYCRLHANCEV
jgi:hypothetical protein